MLKPKVHAAERNGQHIKSNIAIYAKTAEVII
jgi:hypothetical protein